MSKSTHRFFKRAEFSSGQLTEHRLQHILWLTFNQFENNKIEISLLNKEVASMLEFLEQKKLLRMKVLQSTYSKNVLILNVIKI